MKTAVKPGDSLRKITTKAGIVTRQTVPMSLGRANSFAKCLNANGYFSQATVEPTSKGSNRYVVCYLPADPNKQESLVAGYQQEQVERAIIEMVGYTWENAGRGGQYVTTLPDPKTGQRDTWLVTADSCTCPHFQYRLKSTGCLCKHIVAFHAMGFGPQEAEPSPVPSTPYSQLDPAAKAARIYDDFGF